MRDIKWKSSWVNRRKDAKQLILYPPWASSYIGRYGPGHKEKFVDDRGQAGIGDGRGLFIIARQIPKT